MKGIEKHIETWETSMARNDSYALAMMGYVDYWKIFMSKLQKPNPNQLYTLFGRVLAINVTLERVSWEDLK